MKTEHNPAAWFRFFFSGLFIPMWVMMAVGFLLAGLPGQIIGGLLFLMLVILDAESRRLRFGDFLIWLDKLIWGEPEEP